MTAVIMSVATAVVVLVLMRLAAWSDTRHRMRNCQVCKGLGAVSLTDIERGKYLCPEHAESAIRIHRLESELFG